MYAHQVTCARVAIRGAIDGSGQPFHGSGEDQRVTNVRCPLQSTKDRTTHVHRAGQRESRPDPRALRAT
ncbi:hypothetical protein CHU98_g1058 [Xylaria longipes]|nr:hypothetical protein CHU98_g1058 [Xylaria longipes]